MPWISRPHSLLSSLQAHERPMLPRQVQRPNPRQRLTSQPGLPDFTPRQRLALDQGLHQLGESPHWHGQLPVMVLDRCWLNLQAIPVERLAQVLPPDTSSEAPELVQFRRLVQQGQSIWSAEQQCWQDFGAEAWHQALRRFWTAQDLGNHDWTLQRYLDLLGKYRQPFRNGGPRQLPLVVLARPQDHEPHATYWIDRQGLSMRHTCP